MPGFEAVADDLLFQLADAALACEADTREGHFAIARFNVRVAGLINEPAAKSALLARAPQNLRRGVELEVFTPGEVLADPELAPFAGQF